jgi:hypothetical protein
MLNLSISQTIDLIDDLWLLGTFTDFSPDKIEFFSSVSYFMVNTMRMVTILIRTAPCHHFAA